MSAQNVIIPITLVKINTFSPFNVWFTISNTLKIHSLHIHFSKIFLFKNNLLPSVRYDLLFFFSFWWNSKYSYLSNYLPKEAKKLYKKCLVKQYVRVFKRNTIPARTPYRVSNNELKLLVISLWDTLYNVHTYPKLVLGMQYVKNRLLSYIYISVLN